MLLFKIPYYGRNIFDVSTKPFWVISKAVDMFQDDERFKAVERSRDREDLFENFIMELQKKVKFCYFSYSCMHLQTYRFLDVNEKSIILVYCFSQIVCMCTRLKQKTSHFRQYVLIHTNGTRILAFL